MISAFSFFGSPVTCQAAFMYFVVWKASVAASCSASTRRNSASISRFCLSAFSLAV